MQFDARAAKLLKAGEHIIVEGCPGLRLEATATTRTWTYRYKSPLDERMRQVKIGAWPAKSLAVAAAEWEGLRAVRDAGGDPAKTKRDARRAERAEAAAPVAMGYTVRQLCDDYLAGHVDKHRKPKGAKEVRRLLTLYVEPIESIQAAQLTRRQAFDLLAGHVERPVVAAMLRGELGAAWDYALDAGEVPGETPNWWRLIMRGRLRSKGKKIQGEHIGTGKRALSEVEAGTLINWLPNFSRLVDDALIMYLWTLTRGAEIMSIEKEEVSDERDGLWWTIPKAKTKNARHENATDLRVPLVGRAEQVVRRRMAMVESGALFPSRKKDGTVGAVEQKTIQTSVYWHQPYSETTPEQHRERLPVTHWSPHDLRRTGRTMLASMGCPAELGEAVLGHMIPGVRGVYDRHAYDKERREWLTKLSARWEVLARKAGSGKTSRR